MKLLGKEIFESPELNIYLEFPAHLMVKKKNIQDKYKEIGRFKTMLSSPLTVRILQASSIELFIFRSLDIFDCPSEIQNI